MVNVPEELLMNILCRLPVESLLRYKCVCKSWYALLGSPKFVKKHLANQSNDNVILKENAGGNLFYFLSNIGTDGHDLSCFVEAGLDSIFPPARQGYGNYLGMHGYCDGIILLSNYEEEIVVCNPAIREARALPKFNLTIKHPDSPNHVHSIITTIGFGYDPKTDDYKVVRIMAFWVENEPSIKVPDRNEVFSLRADSAWRELKVEVGAILYLNDELEQYLDGFHYWCGGDEENNKKFVVVSFDMANEVFQKSQIPDACEVEGNTVLLGVYDESIAMYVQPFCIRTPDRLDVWVTKEFGVKESWTKQLTIEPLVGLGRPLVFWKNNKELLQEDWKHQLASYDLATMESKQLPVELNRCSFKSWRAYLYKKTLISVKGKEDITV